MAKKPTEDAAAIPSGDDEVPGPSPPDPPDVDPPDDDDGPQIPPGDDADAAEVPEGETTTQGANVDSDEPCFWAVNENGKVVFIPEDYCVLIEDHAVQVRFLCGMKDSAWRLATKKEIPKKNPYAQKG